MPPKKSKGQRAWIAISRNRDDLVAHPGLQQNLGAAREKGGGIKLFDEVYGDVDIIVGVQVGEGASALFELNLCVDAVNECGKPDGDQALAFADIAESSLNPRETFIRNTRTYAVVDSTASIDPSEWPPGSGYLLCVRIHTTSGKHQDVRRDLNDGLKKAALFKTFLVDIVLGDCDVILAASVKPNELGGIIPLKEFIRTVDGVSHTVTYFSCELIRALSSLAGDKARSDSNRT